MQFTHSQGLCILKKWGFAKGCHLPSPSQSAHSLWHSSVTVLLPSSFSCVFDIWGPFLSWWLNIAQLHNSTAGLCHISPTLPVPLASVLCRCVPRVCPLPPHQKWSTFPFPPLFPPSFPGESPRLVTPLLPASPAACAQHSKGEEVAARPTQAGGHNYLLQAPVSWEEKCCCCSCHHPRRLVRKLMQRMRKPSIAGLCCLLFIILLCLTAASLSSIPSRESGNLWRKEIICPSWAWQMTPWPRKFSNT